MSMAASAAFPQSPFEYLSPKSNAPGVALILRFKKYLLQFYSWTGVIFITFFIGIYFTQQRYFDIGVLGTIALIVLINLFLLKVYPSFLEYSISIAIFFAFCTVVFLILGGGFAENGIYWALVLPHIVIPLHGRVKGVLWCVFLLLVLQSAWLFGYLFQYDIVYYSRYAIIQLLFCYTFVIFLVLLYQVALERQESQIVLYLYQLREARDNFREAQLRSDAIIASMGEALIVVDNEGKIIRINPIACALLCDDDVKIIGASFFEYVRFLDTNGKTVPKTKTPLFQAMKLQTRIERTSLSLRNKRKKGTSIPLAITASPLIENDKLKGVVIVFRNLAKEKELETIRREFVSIASHQLKTPLSALAGYLELLGDNSKKMTKEQQEYIHEMTEIKTDMVTLVNQLLNISRIDEGRLSIKTKNEEIETFIKRVVEKIQPMAHNYSAHVSTTVGATCSTMLMDALLLEEIVGNLLSNAIKYSAHKKNAAIILNVRCTPKKFIFEVIDQGIGIPKQEQSHVFTRFFRASNAIKTREEGTGLGLNIVHLLVVASGGTISFRSQEGVGSTFVVSYPHSGMRSRPGERSLAV